MMCPGVPDKGIKAHLAHLTEFYLSGSLWWYDEKNHVAYGRPSSYCKACVRTRYNAPKEELVQPTVPEGVDEEIEILLSYRPKEID